MTADIRFGTDGWRAVIGADYTYDNVRRVADAAGRVFAADNQGAAVVLHRAGDDLRAAGSRAADGHDQRAAIAD